MMKAKSVKRKKSSLVQRITVDEIISEDLIRFEICDLKEGVPDFSYEIDVWERGYGLVVHGDAYGFELGIDYPWDLLEEGDVYLNGYFEVIIKNGEPVRFKVSPDKRRFLQINWYDGFNDYGRTLYSSVLRRG
jgi:hypothetical protein